jgi:Leucine-rich repeat (LRR) protein
MDFDKHKVAEYYDYAKKEIDFPDAYITELFLIGKITQDEQLKLNITTILNDCASKDINKAFRSNTKIPMTGKYTDYDKTLEALISFGNKAQDLDIGKIFALLGYDSLLITKAALATKVNQNLWLFTRLEYVKKLMIWNETFPSGIIPNEIGAMTGLEELEIRGAFKNIPDTLSKLNKLKKLELRMSHIAILPDALQELTQLEELEIAGEGTSLAKEYNEVLTLPHWIGGLQNLKKLEIGYLTTDKIDEAIFPPNLVSLRIYRMHNIKTLPEKIADLQYLESFELYVCNQLEALPSQMYKLDKLEIFKIGTLPKLKSIDGNIVFSPTIKTISLIDGISITKPKPEQKINHTKELKIQNQAYLEYFVAHSDLFPDLESLYINDIKKYELTKGIGNLKNLKLLYVSQLGDIPALFAELGSCPNLETIKINNSQLRTFPNIRALANLSEFKVHYCNELNLHSDNLPASFDTLDIAGAQKFTFGQLPMRLNSFNAYATHFDNFEAIGEVLDVCKLKLYFSAPYTIDGKIKIDNLPASIAKMQNLISFTFHGKATKIDIDLNALQKLELLELSGLDSTGFSGGLSFPIEYIAPFELPNLKNLKLSNYKGDNLEEIFDNLGNLRALDLDHIQHYATLPTAKMKVLERIKLYSCNVHNLQAVQPSIKYFEAYFCKNINKQSIETISTWANLTELHLKYISDDVNILPESLSQLKLRVLDLNHIPLNVIPDFIGQIYMLNVLYLDGFYVDDLPKSIASLPNLSYLSIESTTFRHKLAEDFRQLKIKQLKIYRSKFAGNNMKQDLYEPLITPNMTKIVREFKFE